MEQLKKEIEALHKSIQKEKQQLQAQKDKAHLVPEEDTSKVAEVVYEEVLKEEFASWIKD